MKRSFLLLIACSLTNLAPAVLAEAQTLSQQSARLSVGTVKSVEVETYNKRDAVVTVARHPTPRVERSLNTAKIAETRKQRRNDVGVANKQGHIEVFDAWSYLDVDLDADGYFSEFTLGFDIDTSMSFADVFAEIYISENGGPWYLLHTTDVFRIFGAQADSYEISFTLNQDYPSNDYDILIDVYEYGVSGIVDTYAAANDIDLALLPLEDRLHETTVELASIDFVATTLSSDLDADGYFTELSIEYDISTQVIGDWVYAELIITSSRDASRQFVDTEVFVLDNQTEIIDLSFDTGYLPAGYDVEINLISEVTGEVLASTDGSFNSLRNLPIESKNNDRFYDAPDDVVVVVESGGGSIGWLLSLFVFSVVRRLKRS